MADIGFVDLSLSLQDLLSLGLAKPGFDDLKGLVAVKPGVKLQRRIRDSQAGLIKCPLQAAQVVRHAVDERALNVKYITGEHFQMPYATRTQCLNTCRENGTGSCASGLIF